jgi:hypothetical protein
MSFALKVLPNKPVLGRFDKSVAGGMSVNFGMSAGKHCDVGCRYHPENPKSDAAGRCYAIRSEHRFDRVQLLAKLMRHENADPTLIARRALAELQVVYAGGNKVPWFRISTNGSVPQPSECTRDFRKAFVELLEFCDKMNIPVHLPVETRRKYRYYKKLVGSLCVVRLSAGSEKDFIVAKEPVSFVGGHMLWPGTKKRMTRPERVEESKRLAKLRMDHTGRKTVVCPAVADYYLNHRPHAESKAKCGNCVACAVPDVDVVYPVH